MTRKKTVRKVEPEIVGSKNRKSSADDLRRDLTPYRDERTAVAVYEKDCAKIEAMHSIPEFKLFDAKMAALGAYAKKAKDKKAEFTVSALRIRNMRRAGQIIVKEKKKGRLADRGRPKQRSSADDLYYLDDLDITKNQSSYWQAVAAIPKKEFDDNIERARASADKVDAVHAIAPHMLIRMLVKGDSRKGRQDDVADEKGRTRGPFAVIYADPPWPYEKKKMVGGISVPYKTLSMEGIGSFLDDREIQIAEGAVLFLWATTKFLPEALWVMGMWGFRYTTAIAWDKRAGCWSEYFDARWEILLMGHRMDRGGKALMPSVTNEPNFRSISRKANSQKPEEFRSMIERMYPAFDFDTRLELFGRPPTAPARGWTAMVEGAFKNHPDDIAVAVAESLANGGLLHNSRFAPIVEALDEPDKFFPPEVHAAMGLPNPMPKVIRR